MEEGIKINKQHEEGIIKAIKENPIYNFNNIFLFYMGCSRATAYNHNLDKLDSIKEAIYSNKRKGVTSLLNKWIDSDNATLSMGAMKMLCDDEERRALSMQHNDTTIHGSNDAIIVKWK